MGSQQWQFRSLPEFFIDYISAASKYPYGRLRTQPRFGLKSQAFPTDDPGVQCNTSDWTRFAFYINWLSQKSPEHISYKILFLTRHGLGFHNKKQAEVGDEAWNNHWSFQNGDGQATWFDSYLTETGIQQAGHLSQIWLDAVSNQGVPLPQKLYTSPLARCLQTTALSFEALFSTYDKPFQPHVRERLRERNTLHTCDFRRPRSWIENNYPQYLIGSDVTEQDVFQEAIERQQPETEEEHYLRKQSILDEIFTNDDQAHFISLTVHWYAIKAIFQVCNTEFFKVGEGTCIALFVKGERH